MSQYRVDSHCHLFNARYALREGLAIAKDALLNKYPRQAPVGLVPLTAKSLLDKIKTLIGIFKVATNSCPENYRDMIREYNEQGAGVPPLVCMPLMMDIYYIFAHQLAAGQGMAGLAGNPLAEFQALANDVLVTLQGTVQHHTPEAAQYQQALQQIVAEAKAELTGHPLPLAARSNINFAGMPVSRGYRKHMEELLELQAGHTQTIFPFIAVDPRRPRIKNFLQQGTASGKPIISRHGPFYGIKVYPPLGYHPGVRALRDIYQWCAKPEVDLPVTAHCQPNSFYNKICGSQLDPKSGKYFADPEHWETVLTNNENLRINFAHFGGADNILIAAGMKQPGAYPHDGSWTTRIISWIDAGRTNVYADVAACSSPDIVEAVKRLVQQHPNLGKQLMFGTDYIICMLGDGLGGELDRYYTNFNDLSDDLLYGNAVRFLNTPMFREDP